MKQSVCLILMLLACTPAFGQQEMQKTQGEIQEVRLDRNQLKPRIADKKFWTLTAVQFGAAVFDIESSQAGLRNGAVEGNPLFGSHPSRARMYGISMPQTAAVCALGYWLKKTGRDTDAKRGSSLWWMLGAANATAHVALSVHNLQVTASNVHKPSSGSPGVGALRSRIVPLHVCPAKGVGCRE